MTKAHVEIGQIAARELPGWQILYIPAPDRFLTSWKAMEKNDILSGEQRLNLLRKAVEPHGFLCEDCEVHLKTSAKTYDTMQYLRVQYGQDTQLVYVCGTDKLSELFKKEFDIKTVDKSEYENYQKMTYRDFL